MIDYAGNVTIGNVRTKKFGPADDVLHIVVKDVGGSAFHPNQLVAVIQLSPYFTGGQPHATTGSRFHRIGAKDMPTDRTGNKGRKSPASGLVVFSDPGGTGAPVLIPEESYESALETAEILADKAFVDQLGQSLKEMEAGEMRDWDTVKASMGI